MVLLFHVFLRVFGVNLQLYFCGKETKQEKVTVLVVPHL